MTSLDVFVLAVCAFIPGLTTAQAPLGLTDGIQLLQVAAGQDYRDSDSAFLDNEGVLCIQGPARTLEAAVATKKASPLGGLYNTSFAKSGVVCADRGYGFQAGDDQCFVGIQSFFRSEDDLKRFKDMEAAALRAYRLAHSIDAGMATVLVGCTCHPKSPARVNMEKICEDVNEDAIGSWVHQNPESGKDLACFQGPFEYTARALATLKSTPLLPMHLHDQIAPVSCAARGFPAKSSADPCWPSLGMWTRTEWQAQDCMKKDSSGCDEGVTEMFETANSLVEGGRFKDFAKKHGLTAALHSVPKCSCALESDVTKALQKSEGPDVCTFKPQSPVRDFWVL